MLTTDDLSQRFRSDVGDPLEGVDANTPDSENLWKNWEICEYMSEAADAVARGTLGLYKTVVLPIVATQNIVSLPLYVLQIRSGWLTTAGYDVNPVNQFESSRYVRDDYGLHVVGHYRSATGRPKLFIRDMVRKAIVLIPIPTESDTLELQCSVTLSTPLLPGMPLPFMEKPDQRLMLLYMKYLAYGKQDADTLDLARAMTFKQEFDRDVENREVELRKQRRVPAPIAMEGW